MLIFLNKIFRRARHKIRLGSQPATGQVALILILISAMALIFFAVSLNLGQIAQLKAITQTAADISAAAMASSFTSYTEQVYQTQLGGQKGAGDDLTI